MGIWLEGIKCVIQFIATIRTSVYKAERVLHSPLI